MTTLYSNGLYIGLMCGTSADAIDAVLVRWEEKKGPFLLETHSQPLPTLLRRSLLALNNAPTVSAKELCRLDTQVAQAHTSAVATLLQKSGLLPFQIHAIGFHGQTVDHSPQPPVYNSMQIGNAHLLAAKCKIPVIADVRRADIAAGGQGAPLAPALHAELFRNSAHDTAVVNIGGIANLSLLPSNSKQPVLGFDTGPGNCLMDEWIQKKHGQPYDREGSYAESGIVQKSLVEKWSASDYFQQHAPKSTGRDLFNLPWLEQSLAEANYKPEDVQASLLALTVKSIAADLMHYMPSVQQLYVCGGGAHNSHLMNELQKALPNTAVNTTDHCGISPDWVEGLLMAWLARQYCLGKPGNLPSVTGASKPVRLGLRFEPP